MLLYFRLAFLYFWGRLSKLWSRRTILHQGALEVTYTYGGEQHTAYLPYKPILVGKMKRTRVLLHYNNGEIKEIRQQPGVAYLVTPRQLGAAYATMDIDGQIKTFNGASLLEF